MLEAAHMRSKPGAAPENCLLLPCPSIIHRRRLGEDRDVFQRTATKGSE